MLIERGATWKDETAFGTPIPRVLAIDFESRPGSHQKIPEEMPKLMTMYETGEPPR